MSRITAPVSKLTRTIGSSASIPRPSHLLQNASKSASASAVEHHSEHHDRHISTPTHRPQPTPSRTRIVPLMQTFTTSSHPRARSDTSTIDYAIMPTFSSLSPNTDGAAVLRVPLLPDSFTVTHTTPETLDPPLPSAEISIVAADPENVLGVSPLTEVEGMDAQGVELGFVHGLETQRGGRKEGEEGGGMIRDLWKGLMEDVFGEEKKTQHA